MTAKNTHKKKKQNNHNKKNKKKKQSEIPNNRFKKVLPSLPRTPLQRNLSQPVARATRRTKRIYPGGREAGEVGNS